MTWSPHVTVAAIIERNGKFLLVEENIDGDIVYNQPAGHLEANETLVEAVIREVQEETAWDFEPTAIIGLYRMHLENKNVTYLRVCFSGTVNNHQAEQALDDGIIGTTWMDMDEIESNKHSLRSPLVLECINDYLAGQTFPIAMIKDTGNV